MKLTRCKKIFLIIALTAFVVLLVNSNTIFAAVNTEYSGADAVPDTNLEEAFDDSNLLNLLAKLIYAVGRFLEWILGTIFKMLTGTSDFPWADKIVFNAVPLLDVNFINPGGTINNQDITGQTFVGLEPIQAVLKNLYATILTLAATFFGIVVLITAIKLVISTIASDKAKYKQAIVDWLIGFVMLFCIHYAISFIFYLNEQLVVVASKIVTTQLDKKNVAAVAQSENLVDELIENVRNKGTMYNGKSVADILESNKSIVSQWINLTSTEKSKGLQEALAKDLGVYNDWRVSTEEQYKNLGMIISWAASANVSTAELTEIRNNIKVFHHYVTKKVTGTGDQYCSQDCADELNRTGNREQYDACVESCNSYEQFLGEGYNQALSVTDIKKIFSNNDSMYIEFMTALQSTTPYAAEQSNTNPLIVEAQTTNGGNSNLISDWLLKGTIDRARANNYYLISSGANSFANKYDEGNIGATNFFWTQVLDDMIRLKGSSNTSTGTNISGSGKVRLISDLGAYFRYNSYNKKLRNANQTAVKNGKKIYIQNMIMYAILVAQSLILFISYVKRLFYVILLAMMAPIVVVFDFFQKFGR